MGALILLLLVTTRRIRQQAVERHQQEMFDQQAATTSPAPPAFLPTLRVAPVPIPPLSAIRPEDIAPRLPVRQEPEVPAGPTPRELAEMEYQQQVRAREREQQQLAKEWQSHLNSLRIERDKLQRIVADSRQTLDQQKLSQQQQMAAKSQLVSSSTEQLQVLQRQLQQEQQTLEEERTKTQKLLERLQVDQALAQRKQEDQRPRLAIVAHDPQAGTNRHPILIECRNDSLTFASEQLTISAETLSGFTPDYNPLRAGTQALINYWKKVDAANGKEATEPYVLLVIRPAGTVGFYVARKMLEQLETPTGYELILESDEMAWPEPDPQAVALCQQAINEVLSNQAKADATLLTDNRRSRMEELAFADQGGGFRMQEVDRMRNVRDAYSVANPIWTNPYRPPGGSNPQNTATNGAGTGNQFSQGQRSAAEENRPNPFAPQNNFLTNTPRGGTVVPPPVDAQPVEGGASRQTFEAEGPSWRTSPDQPSPGTNPPGQSSAGDSNFTGIPDAPNLESNSLPLTQGTTGQSSLDSRNANGQSGEQEAALWNGPSLPAMPSKAIGIEREMPIEVWEDRIVLGEGNHQTTIPLEQGWTTPALAQLSRSIEAEFTAWGPAPASFAWRPEIQLMVHPGGNLQAGRLQQTLQRWKVKYRIEQVLD